MTLLERLKELNAGNEWDFNDLGFLVNGLPDLIAVVEAAVEYRDAEYKVTSKAYKNLCVALAKLEGGAE
jgi:hypothetical protein